MKLFGDFKHKFKRAKPYLGVAIDAGEIRAARLMCNGHGPQVEATAQVSGSELDTGGTIDGVALTNALRELASAVGYGGEPVVSALPGMTVIERLIKVPVMPAGELEAAIHWEAEQHIPVPLNDMILRHVVLGEEQSHEHKLRIIVAACRRETVLSFHQAFVAAGLTLVALDLPALALWRYFCGDENKECSRRTAIVNVDAAVTQCLFTEGDRLLFSRTSPVGSRSIGLDKGPSGNGKTGSREDPRPIPVLDRFKGPLTGEVAADAQRLPSRGALAVLDGAREEDLFAGPFQWRATANDGVVVSQLAGEIKRSLEFFRSTYGNWVPEQVVLSGPAARWPDLAGHFADELDLEVSVAVPGGIQPAEGDSAVFDPALATACGLAMWGVKQ